MAGKKKDELSDGNIYAQTLEDIRRTSSVMGKIVIFLSSVLILALAVIFYQALTKEKNEPSFFAVDAQGKLTKLEPVNREIGMEAVSNFTTELIQKSFTMNYRNYKEVMSSVAPMYSSGAFVSYREGMENGDTSIVGTLTSQKLSVETIVIAKRLIQKTTVKNRAAWIVEADANRTFFSQGSQKTIPVTYRITLVRESSMVTPHMLVAYSIVEMARPSVSR